MPCPNNIWNHTNGCTCVPDPALQTRAEAPFPAPSPPGDPYLYDEEGTPVEMVPADVQPGDVLRLDDGDEVVVSAVEPYDNQWGGNGYRLFTEDGQTLDYDYETYFAERIGHQPLEPPVSASTDPFVGEAAASDRQALHQVVAWMHSDPQRYDLSADYPSRVHIAQALHATTGRWDEPELVDAIRHRLHTDTFSDDDGEHAPQVWSALDADDRYSGKFTVLTAIRDGVRMKVDEGDASSYKNPGFSWTVEIDNHVYSGQADTAEQAQREAVAAADHITSGQAEADLWAALDAEERGSADVVPPR